MKTDVIVKEFNRTHVSKAKLISALEKSIVIEMSGRSEEAIENDMYALRAQIEKAINESLLIRSIRKSGNKFTIKFSIEKSPAEDILEILKRYDEGTAPEGYVPEE